MGAMTRRLSSVLSVVLGLLALGCSGRAVPREDAGGGGGDDAGRPTADAGAQDAGPTGMDAGPPDAGVDAGPPDAGPPPCDCPPFPTSCTPPAADTPVFTPDAEALAGQLFDVVACADETLQIAIYDWTWECLADAVQLAIDEDPDLRVEIVVDDTICEPGDCLADTLSPSERVTVVRDTRSSELMHHKYVIADGERLWVTSGNLTWFSFCSDHNNGIVVEQPAIVARYQAIFERMFTDVTFGPVDPEAPVSGGVYTAYFSPETPASQPAAWQEAMVAAIAAAETSVEVMISAWTRTEISDALVAAHEAGVAVRALVSNVYADDAPAQALRAAGVDVRRGKIHDKVLILDGRTVVTGSANWSRNAWSNNENSLWIDDATVAAAYQGEFEEVFAIAPPAEAP
jgi:hypothetical protein